MTDQPALRVCLLGDFSAVYNGVLVTALNVARLQNLLAYLTLHRQATHSREHLASIFWPDSVIGYARTNLRGVLYPLQALPDRNRYIGIDAHTVYWSVHAPYSTDVADFEAALKEASDAEREGRRQDAMAVLERAIVLYRGELLPRCDADWVKPIRERLQRAFIDALERLVYLHEGVREYTAAIRYASRVLTQDALRESMYRTLMRLHALNEDRAAALRVYRDCQVVLRHELGIEPESETQELYEQLKLAESPHAGSHEAPIQPDAFRSEPLRLIGREGEWHALQEAWRVVAYGRPHCVVVLGEAGIGKTRLAEEMGNWVRRQGMSLAVARCYAGGDAVAFVPVIDWLRSRVVRRRLASLERPWRAEVARLLPDLAGLGAPVADLERAPEAHQRQQLLEGLGRAVLHAPQPILLVLDDAQWCDYDTFEWIRYLLRWPARAKLLLLVTARVEELSEQHELRKLIRDLQRTNQLSELHLGPLAAPEIVNLAEQLAGQTLTAQQAHNLYAETEGNPLFVKETIRAVLELGDPSLSKLGVRRSLSPTVESVIARRLAQLSSSARDLVSLAATIGREFSAVVLKQASNRDDEPLARDLDELWQRHIIREAPGAHVAVTDRYDFTHDKIREAAYVGLNPIRRRWLHRQVAQALEVGAAESDTVSAQVALHFELAGMPERAISHLMRAAVVARRVYANETALGHLQKALDLLADMPATKQRACQELDVLMLMMTPLIALHGYAAVAVGEAKQRAWDLSQQIGSPEQVVSLAGELWNYHAVRGEWPTALAYGEDYLRLAYHSGDPAIVLEAHRCVDETLMFVGEFGTGRTYTDWERIGYDAQHHGLVLDGRILDAQDPVPMLCFSARMMWYTGYPAQALERMNQALAMAERLGDPYYVAFALSTATQLQLFCGNGESCRGYVDRILELSEKHGFAYLLAGGMFFRGHLTANVDGRFDDGIAQMRDGLSQWRDTGAQLWWPYMLGMLAETCLRAGWVRDGLAATSEALAMGTQNRDRFWEAELHRLKGELIWASVAPDEAKSGVLAEAEQSFQEAMHVAQYQRSKALELRVAISLARLWQAQGNHRVACNLLREVYDWFGEGFNTADLVHARVRLDHLDSTEGSVLERASFRTDARLPGRDA